MHRSKEKSKKKSKYDSSSESSSSSDFSSSSSDSSSSSRSSSSSSVSSDEDRRRKNRKDKKKDRRPDDKEKKNDRKKRSISKDRYEDKRRKVDKDKDDNDRRKRDDYDEKRKYSSRDYDRSRRDREYDKERNSSKDDSNGKRRDDKDYDERVDDKGDRRAKNSDREKYYEVRRREVEQGIERYSFDNSNRVKQEKDSARMEDGEIDDKEEPVKRQPKKKVVERRKPVVNMLATKTGGAYIPPGRLKLMQQGLSDQNSEQSQRISWEALKKSINGLINKVNASNVTIIVRELMKENLIRGRGLLIRSILTAQSFSTTYTNVYACLIAIINTKFPQIGELLLKRLVNQFKKSYRRNDKAQCLTTTKFIAHLVNQDVSHEIIALEILTLLLENVTSDSVEVAVSLMKEVGCKLQKISPIGFNSIFDSLRNIIQESQVDPRIQYMIEVLYEIRKTNFSTYPDKIKELDVIDDDELNTHVISLDDEINTEDNLNVFKFDENYEENENKYKIIIKDILDESSNDESGSDDEDDSEEDEDEEEEEKEAKMEIIDNTETNLVNLRRIIYLTIQSSLGFEEAAHKILKLELKSSQLDIIANMILDCCTQQRTYLKFYGLLGQRFCELNNEIVKHFENIFVTCYNTIQRFETTKLRNVAKFFAHLLFTDSISWTVFNCIILSEEDTCSASRVYIKILIVELSEYMSIKKLNNRFQDETLSESFKGLFPKDNPQNTRFAINYFTSIGLGELTEDLRNYLKTK